MLQNLPTTPQAFITWTWPEIEPHYKDPASRPLTAASADEWLTDWTRLGEKLEEMYFRLALANSVNTVDKEAAAPEQVP
jgi:hypothetical protein